MSGFYLMHRGWQENAVFSREEYSRRDAWVWLIEAAVFQPTEIFVSGRKIALKRGQLCHSLRFMARAWGWDDAKVRRFLSRIEVEKMIACVTDAGQTVITICKYDDYQVPARVADAPTDAAAPQQRRSSDAKKNEGNKGNKEEIDRSLDREFAEWYESYPRREGRGQAMRAFLAARKRGVAFKDLLEARDRFRAACVGKDPKFIRLASTWLNGEGWLDEPTPDPPKNGTPVAGSIVVAEPWEQRLQMYRKGGFWRSEWGFKPGDPGCRVPPQLLISEAVA